MYIALNVIRSPIRLALRFFEQRNTHELIYPVSSFIGSSLVLTFVLRLFLSLRVYRWARLG